MTGTVTLVGAGPGAVDLLTVRAARRLGAADLVLHDALVNPDVLALAPQARRFFVGKRAHRPSMDQDTINRLMVRAAQRGDHVVRLKCGDPFVFGRGGEEGLALAKAGIPFEVVPGLSTALSAPALAGIPVTHRGVSSAFVVVSGHDPATWAPVLQALPPHSATVVVLMGLRARSAIAQQLTAWGWDVSTPAAVVLDASHATQVVWTGSLAQMASGALAEHSSSSAGVLVVGKVVGLAQVLGQGRADPVLAAHSG